MYTSSVTFGDTFPKGKAEQKNGLRCSPFSIYYQILLDFVLFDDLDAAHILAKDFRHHDGAVFKLILLN